MKPSYFIRLDDACPTNNLEKWNCIENLLDSYNIKPIVAVIPENKDKYLLKGGSVDKNFWNRVQRWVNKEWLIALHGYSHEFCTKHRGLIPLNSYSEFAGVPISIQREKIKKGYNIFLQNGITPQIWVAPAHTFDKNTLKVLRDETNIRIISDGLSMFPYKQDGFLWIPQQLWSFYCKHQGVWTICLHPETIRFEEIDKLSKSISDNHSFFEFRASELIKYYSERKKTISDFFFQQHFLLRKKYDHLYSSNTKFRKLMEVLKSIFLKPFKHN